MHFDFVTLCLCMTVRLVMRTMSIIMRAILHYVSSVNDRVLTIARVRMAVKIVGNQVMGAPKCAIVKGKVDVSVMVDRGIKCQMVVMAQDKWGYAQSPMTAEPKVASSNSSHKCKIVAQRCCRDHRYAYSRKAVGATVMGSWKNSQVRRRERSSSESNGFLYGFCPKSKRAKKSRQLCLYLFPKSQNPLSKQKHVYRHNIPASASSAYKEVAVVVKGLKMVDIPTGAWFLDNHTAVQTLNHGRSYSPHLHPLVAYAAQLARAKTI
eukprot:284818827_2